MSDDNIKAIMNVYDAFTRGDVATMLDAVTDDVDWAAETTSTVAPWYGVKHGKQGVAEFFEAFGSTMEVEEFSPTSYAANDTEVLTVVQFRAKVQGTDRTTAMQLHHIFRFRDGKICYYRGSEDSAQTIATLQG
jgi:hypothetical protein